jgi:hypothetical protein
MKTNRPILQIVLVVWVLFSILYIGYTQYKYFTSYVAQSSYQKGLTDAVTQLIQQAQTCQAFPVTYGGQSVNLINTSCNGQNAAQVPTSGSPVTK